MGFTLVGETGVGEKQASMDQASADRTERSNDCGIAGGRPILFG
jgi:hypothetical protein